MAEFVRGMLDADITVSAHVTAKTSTSLLLVWTDVALEHEQTAWAARDELTSQKAAGLPLDAANNELNASLVAIMAASFAIDGVYGIASPHVTIPAPVLATWTRQRVPREGRIVETLKRGFKLGSATNRWPNEFKWLFDLRDVVHPEEQFRDGGLHPVIGANVTVERSLYTAEAARRAVDLLAEVLRIVSDAGNQKIAGLETWMDNNRGAIEAKLHSRVRRP